MRYPIIFYLTLPALLLLAFISCLGVVGGDIYARETLNWQAQSYGQDRIDLFLVAPVWLFTAWFAARGKRNAFLMWGGTCMYLLYTFTIYCFDVHFNQLFIFYCLVFGSSFYSVAYFFYVLITGSRGANYPSIIDRVTGVFLMVIAVLFYLLWLAEIVPSLKRETVPASLIEVGLPTNPVHVIDLAIFLPFLFITGLLTYRGNRYGRPLAIVALAFCVLMDVTIGYLAWYMKQKHVSASINVTYIMAVLILASATLLFLNLRFLREELE